MHIRLIAVGDRQPAWVDQAFGDYAQRLPRQWRFRLQTIATAHRTRDARTAVEAEGRQVLAEIRDAEEVVALDERGTEYSTEEFAARLNGWLAGGKDLCFLIGGPDGLAPDCLARAGLLWSLSRLTLPHGLARVLFAEQLYRAWSLLEGHPYHRQ